MTNGTVSAADAADEMNKCNTNNDNALSYGEVKACLKKNAKALGLNSKKRWQEAKWALASAAVIGRKGFAGAMKAWNTQRAAWKLFKSCNSDGNNVLDYGEVTACMKKHGVNSKDQRKYGNALLRNAFIPKRNWAAVAAGVSKFTGGKVSVEAAADEMNKCNKNGDNRLSFKEVKRCLKKNAKALGLDSKKKWRAAKWGLARAAVITKWGLRRTMRQMM